MASLRTDVIDKSGVAGPVDKAAARAARRPSVPWLALGERFGLLIALIGLVTYFSVEYPDTFATTANWQSILSSQSVTAVIALALMVPLVSGNFDLSIGAVTTLSAMVCAGLMSRDGWGLLPACIAVLVMGLLIGAINGLLVTRLGLNALIATIGSATVIGGLVSWYSNDNSIASGISPGLVSFGTDLIFDVPWLVVVAAATAVAIGYLITQTPFGRRLVAIGSSPNAAELVGIRVNRLVLISYMISGVMAAFAGILLLAQQGSANPGTDGLSILLPALASVYLGASTWRPGQFNVVGTLLGLILVAVTVSGLTLSGAATWVNSVCYGGALVVAVGASAWFRRQRRGS